MSENNHYNRILGNLEFAKKTRSQAMYDIAVDDYHTNLGQLTDEQQQELGILINETRAVIDNNIMRIPVIDLNQQDSDQLELAIAEAKKEDSTHTFDSAKALMSYLNDCLLDDPECEMCQS